MIRLAIPVRRHSGERGAPASGLSLVEVLVALVLFAVVLLVAGYFTFGSLRTYRVALQVLEQAQFIKVAEEVVLQELRLAGYGLAPAVPDSAPHVTVEVHINPHPDRSDTVRVHYQEERWLAQPELRDITIDVSSDGQGT